ncbi:hypothetical protein [Bacillus taeanensis]|uniref:Uncharacterized protein n=1 Tax=Bacillus taeanensis TaxID=273032 RepID=A0A366XTU3_9BACI|nr:hypothetical protein [Bacillus taeanensis]RBW69086.1 hypothetical protein DS031_13080 [Bacillus taeanensis]
MNFQQHELTVIEQALKQAMNQSTDYQEIYAYEELLKKCSVQNAAAKQDGFRYDYDDSFEL